MASRNSLTEAKFPRSQRVNSKEETAVVHLSFGTSCYMNTTAKLLKKNASVPRWFILLATYPDLTRCYADHWRSEYGIIILQFQ